MTKLNLKLKLFFLIKIFILFLIINFKSFAGEFTGNKNTILIGPNDAKIKIKVFSSFTCPHCANFHNKVVPEIKKKYIDNGSVQIIFIDFPLDQAAFNASKLLHCLEKNKQIKFMDIIYENQKKWISGTNINEINNNLKKIVKEFGINSSKFDNCLLDEAISDKILNERIKAVQKYEINSTPTIVINEEKFKGSADFKNIKKEIEKII